MYEVVLEDEEGNLTGWTGGAWSQDDAVSRAQSKFPELNVVGAMELRV